MIDDTDGEILNILQGNARTSNAEIARRVGLAPSAVFERLRKLEGKGVIEGYWVKLNPKAIGLPLVCFIFVRSCDRAGNVTTAERLARIPEVLEVHHVAGEDCFLVKVRAADTEAVGKLLREQFGKIATITSTRTTIVLETVKETAALPIAAFRDEEAEARRA